MSVLPLEQRTVPVDGRNGVRRDVPALSEVWIQPRLWFPYFPPPPDTELNLPGSYIFISTGADLGS